jgi:phospholipid/cholesterol/gamma-HCH transport system permease protein
MIRISKQKKDFPLTDVSKQIDILQLQAEYRPEGTTILLPEKLDVSGAGICWQQLERNEIRLSGDVLIMDASNVRFCDGSGIALLFTLDTLGRQKNMRTEIRGLSAEIQSLMQRFDRDKLSETLATPPKKTPAVEEIGKTAVHLLKDFREQITFLGHWNSSMLWTVRHLKRIRWSDFFKQVDMVGVNAVGIVMLLGFLFGLIMAFSSAMPLRQFGVEVYVSDLVAIAMIRVLGPFITAVIMAGRTGSAFAAELGTMKINNELDALEVMSLEPMRFLVVPRVASTILMAPLLTVLTNFAGLAGSALVLLSLGYSFATYYDHVQYILDGTDIAVGLVKATVFGGLIGGVGCLRGLQTESGAGAVGVSTTRAVVSGIVWIVIAEGIFSVLLYVLDI